MWFIRGTTNSTCSLSDPAQASSTFWPTGQWLRWSADTAILTFSVWLFAVNIQGFSSLCSRQKKPSWRSSGKIPTRFSIESSALSTFLLNLLLTRNWAVKKIRPWTTSWRLDHSTSSMPSSNIWPTCRRTTVSLESIRGRTSSILRRQLAKSKTTWPVQLFLYRKVSWVWASLVRKIHQIRTSRP